MTYPTPLVSLVLTVALAFALSGCGADSDQQSAPAKGSSSSSSSTKGDGAAPSVGSPPDSSTMSAGPGSAKKPAPDEGEQQPPEDQAQRTGAADEDARPSDGLSAAGAAAKARSETVDTGAADPADTTPATVPAPTAEATPAELPKVEVTPLLFDPPLPQRPIGTVAGKPVPAAALLEDLLERNFGQAVNNLVMGAFVDLELAKNELTLDEEGIEEFLRTMVARQNPDQSLEELIAAGVTSESKLREAARVQYGLRQLYYNENGIPTDQRSGEMGQFLIQMYIRNNLNSYERRIRGQQPEPEAGYVAEITPLDDTSKSRKVSANEALNLLMGLSNLRGLAEAQERVLEQAALAQALAQADQTVTDAEVAGWAATQRAKYAQPLPWAQICRLRGTTPEAEMETWRRIQAWKRITGTEPTREERMAFLQVNKPYFRGDTRRVSHILVRTVDPNTGLDLPQEALAGARQRIELIQRKLEEGMEFGWLAKSYSEDPATAKQEGRLGQNIKPWGGGLDPDFQDAAWALGQVGDVSTPIRSSYGWHLIKLDEKKASSQGEPDWESPRFWDHITEEYEKKQMASWLEQLLADSQIEAADPEVLFALKRIDYETGKLSESGQAEAARAAEAKAAAEAEAKAKAKAQAEADAKAAAAKAQAEADADADAAAAKAKAKAEAEAAATDGPPAATPGSSAAESTQPADLGASASATAGEEVAVVPLPPSTPEAAPSIVAPPVDKLRFDPALPTTPIGTVGEQAVPASALLRTLLDQNFGVAVNSLMMGRMLDLELMQAEVEISEAGIRTEMEKMVQRQSPGSSLEEVLAAGITDETKLRQTARNSYGWTQLYHSIQKSDEAARKEELNPVMLQFFIQQRMKNYQRRIHGQQPAPASGLVAEILPQDEREPALISANEALDLLMGLINLQGLLESQRLCLEAAAIDQALAAGGKEVTEAEIRAWDLQQKAKYPPPFTWDQICRLRGTSTEREMIRYGRILAWRRLTGATTEKPAVMAFLKENKGFFLGHTRKVSHILVRTTDPATGLDLDGDALDAAEQRAKTLASKLEEGSDFEWLAQNYSEDPGSAKEGGKITTPFKQWGGGMDPAFVDAAWKLEGLGAVSEPVRSAMGWHVIRLDEITKPDRGEPNWEEPSYWSYVVDEFETKRMEAWLEGLLEEAQIEAASPEVVFELKKRSYVKKD